MNADEDKKTRTFNGEAERMRGLVHFAGRQSMVRPIDVCHKCGKPIFKAEDLRYVRDPENAQRTAAEHVVCPGTEQWLWDSIRDDKS